jgi:hypothetical protein
MRDEFLNRLAMFQTSLNTLNSTEHKPTWFNQNPPRFTTKVGATAQALTDLEEYCRQQEAATTGAAEQKGREETEAEDAAFTVGRVLVTYFRDHGNETDAAKADLPISEWRALRDQQLLEKARLVRDLAQGLTAGATAANAAEYGIDAAAVEALTKEIDDYASVITAPQQTIGGRAALTRQARPRFNAVEKKFGELDDLILLFGKTAPGRALIAAYRAARIVRDAGHGPQAAPPPPAAAPTPPAPTQ